MLFERRLYLYICSLYFERIEQACAVATTVTNQLVFFYRCYLAYSNQGVRMLKLKVFSWDDFKIEMILVWTMLGGPQAIVVHGRTMATEESKLKSQASVFSWFMKYFHAILMKNVPLVDVLLC